jgi:hypothetical protein
LDVLAGRHVLSLIGWGVADDLESEPAVPPPAVLDALQRRTTPDGLPAVAVGWVGEQYGRDVLLGRATLVSTVPASLVAAGGAPVGRTPVAYVVSNRDLVLAAADDLEPSFARAARLAWHAAARTPQVSRLALERCCVMWVAIGRPSEALSHVLKLAASQEPGAMAVAWELLTVSLLALARHTPSELNAMDAGAALRRLAPEFIDWADSAGPVEGPAAFITAFHDLLSRARQAEAGAMAEVLGELRQLWHETATPGQPVAEVFTPPAESADRLDKAKKRRF